MSSFLDFSGFESGNLLAWTTAGTPTVETYGSTGDHAVRVNASGEGISKTFSGHSSLENFTVGCNVSPHATGVFEMEAQHGGNTWEVRLTYSTDHWEVDLREASTSRETTELIMDLYDEVNLALVLKPTGGTVFIDGRPVLNYDDNTVNANGVTLVRYSCITAGDFLVDDTYCVKSGFPGILRVPAVRPQADSEVKLEMSVTGATAHKDAVNVHPNDGDTSYISTSTGTEEDWFDTTPITDQLTDEVPKKVLGYKVTAVSKLVSSSPTVQVAIVTKENTAATPDYGGAENLTSSYAEYSNIWEQNPETLAVWGTGEFYPSSAPSVGVQHNGDARTTQVVAEAAIIVSKSDDINAGSGGFDLQFRIPAMSSGNSVTVQTNVALGSQYGGSTVTIGDSGSIYCSIGATSTGSKPTPSEQVRYASDVTGASPTDVRIIYHDTFISVYLNGWWFFTAGFEGMKYTDELSIDMYSTGWSPTITNIVNAELGDWREAIYVDMESPASAGLAAVIQDRPVLMWPNPDGTMRFTYGDADGGPITIDNDTLRKHSRTKTNDPRAAADVIVRAGDVAIMHDTTYAVQKGFQTRIYNLGTLDSGGVEAARRLLIRARQNAIRHNITLRPDLRLVIGDEISVSYTSVGGRSEAYNMVVEGISIKVNYGKGTMVLQGREI